MAIKIDKTLTDPSGGFCIHGRSAGRRLSAWFDEEGSVRHAEKIDARGRARALPATDQQAIELMGAIEASKRRHQVI